MSETPQPALARQRSIGVRWTVGDVSPPGFAALRLSILGACKIFGEAAQYSVCVNTIPVAAARRTTGEVPAAVDWREAGSLPASLVHFLDPSMAEGVAWKLAPLRLFPDRYEIALDNDCIIWALPEAMQDWLSEPEARCLIAADVRAAFGSFAEVTRPDPRNTGIRGMPPGYDLEATLRHILERHPVPLKSELDEQGLQAAALDHPLLAHIVSTDDVSICSPFWPHQPWLGRCGAHFVGLNVRELPFFYYDRPGTQLVLENWHRHLPEIHRRLGLDGPEPDAGR